MTIHELENKATSPPDVKTATEEAARALGLVTTQVTTAATYPGSVHWHFKRGRKRGTLEATCWPDKTQGRLSYRSGRGAEWLVPAVQGFKKLVEAALSRR